MVIFQFKHIDNLVYIHRCLKRLMGKNVKEWKDMATIVAGLAIFISLVGLWLSSTSFKKIDEGNRDLRTQLTADIAKARSELEKRIEGLDKKAGAMGSKVDSLMEAMVQSKETIAMLEKNLDKTTKDLEALIRSIPPQFRQNNGPVRSEFV